MYIVRIEHQVQNFNGWKQAFDSDPVGRQKSGVRRHRVYRSVNNENFVMIDLEFDGLDQAEAMVAALRGLWKNVEGKVMLDPKVQIVELVETIEH